MTSNPMQRKARSSFLLGVLLTVVIAGVIIVLLFFQLTKVQEEKQNLQAQFVNVYILNSDVKSGAKIDISALTTAQALKTAIPSNAIDSSVVAGATTVTAKIDLSKGTVLTKSMLNVDTDPVRDDLRSQEYNSIILPVDLEAGEYIDVRLTLPSGQDYIVVSKKVVDIPTINGTPSATTIKIQLTEEETLTLSNAIVESYKVKGTKLYATKYVEAGNQNAATPTYVPNGEVAALISQDPNIVDKAKQELASRYSATASLRTNYLNSAVNSVDSKDQQTNLESGVTSSTTNSVKTREDYLGTLSN